MSIKLTILGCHSATPRANAFPTSQYLEINNRHFLISIRKYTILKTYYRKINEIPQIHNSPKHLQRDQEKH